jgi:2-oxoglutarate ferredoxin oxidoreductase subunit alpha
MVEDVRLTLEGKRPVELYGRVGGNMPAVEELLAKIEERVPAAV